MPFSKQRFSSLVVPGRIKWTWGDAVALTTVTAFLYFGVRLALRAPAAIEGPAFSLAFSLWYGSLAASNRRAEQILLPLLDVLQSVPILSFLPVVLLGLSAFLSQNAASELASVVLIFTSQAWNLAFAWYQARKTVPRELREVASNFRFSPWLRSEEHTSELQSRL